MTEKKRSDVVNSFAGMAYSLVAIVDILTKHLEAKGLIDRRAVANEMKAFATDLSKEHETGRVLLQSIAATLLENSRPTVQ